MEFKYIVTFYCGFGILDKSITVKAFNESEAIAAAMAICQHKKWFQFFETDESIDRMNLTKAEKKEKFIYVDSSFFGGFPAYYYVGGVGVQKTV